MNFSWLKNKYVQIGIFASVLAFVFHMYAFTNLLVNHDTINYILEGETKEFFFGCGRWMFYWITRMTGTVTMNIIIGLVCALAIGMSVVLLVQMFGIQSNAGIICLSFLIATFPVAANSICYIYNADGLFVALLGGTFGAWLICTKNHSVKNVVITILSLIAVCGIHQSYWCYSVAVAFAFIFILGFRKEFKEIVVFTIRVVVVYAVSIIGYLLVNKFILFITGTDAAGYAGLDNIMDFGGISKIIDIVYLAFKQFCNFYFIDGSFIPSPLFVGINIFLFIIVFLHFAVKSIKEKNVFKFVWLVFLILMYPFIINSVSIASKGYFHAVMMWAFVIPYVVCISVVDQKYGKDERKWKKVYVLALVLLYLIGYNNLLISNKIYSRQELNYEATYAYLNRMLMRIELDENFAYDKKVVFLNETPLINEHIEILAESYPDVLGVYDDCDGMVGCNVHTPVKNLKDIYDFYEIYMGVRLNRPDKEEISKIASSVKFAEMGVYPAENSIEMIDNMVVVKIQNEQ